MAEEPAGSKQQVQQTPPEPILAFISEMSGELKTRLDQLEHRIDLQSKESASYWGRCEALLTEVNTMQSVVRSDVSQLAVSKSTRELSGNGEEQDAETLGLSATRIQAVVKDAIEHVGNKSLDSLQESIASLRAMVKTELSAKNLFPPRASEAPKRITQFSQLTRPSVVAVVQPGAPSRGGEKEGNRGADEAGSPTSNESATRYPRRNCRALPGFKHSVSRGSIQDVYPNNPIVLLAQNPYWNILCTAIALVNAAVIGIEADLQAKLCLTRAIHGDPGDDKYDLDPFVYMDYGFLAWLLLEVAVNLYVQRLDYILGPEIRWNAFDLLIILASVVDIFLKGLDYTFLKVFRVLKLGKLLRTARFAKFLHGVKKMIISLYGSMVACFWAFFLMFLIMFMVSVVMLQGVSIQLDTVTTLNGTVPSLNSTMADGAEARNLAVFEWDPSNEERYHNLNMLYGSLGKVMLTLFRAISGGIEWGVAAEPITSLHWVYGFVWTVYMAFMVFGVLNVLTGIFVEYALAAAQQDREIAIQEQHAAQSQMRAVMQKVFAKADEDMSGNITEDEFCQLLADADVVAHLRSLGVDTSDAEGLFALLDEDASGTVSIEEFIDGCLRLKGGAKSVDMLTLLFESRKMMKQLRHINYFVTRISEEIDHSDQSPSSRCLPAWGRNNDSVVIKRASPGFLSSDDGSEHEEMAHI